MSRNATTAGQRSTLRNRVMHFLAAGAIIAALTIPSMTKGAETFAPTINVKPVDAPQAVAAIPAPVVINTDSAVRIDVGSGHGSGVYLGNGYVLTAAHIVADEYIPPVVHSFDDKVTSTADVIYADTKKDISLLKLTGNVDAQFTASKVTCYAPAIKQVVTIVGWPMDLGRLEVSGTVVSDTGPRVEWSAVNIMIAPIIFGNSGGPVYNDKGDVLGIVVSIMRGTSIAMFVPSRAVCDQLPRGSKSH